MTPGRQHNHPTTTTQRSVEALIRDYEGVIPLLPYQHAAIVSGSRFTWNCWSRQTGKSFTFSLRRLVRGLARHRNQIILSAGERQSREVMEKVRLHCRALKIWSELREYTHFAGVIVRRLEIRLPGGMRVIGLPANPMTARGFTGDVFLDEFAMHRDDAEIWSALFPTLLRGEGELDIASTPRGRKNQFYHLKENERFARATLTLADAVAAGLDVDPVATRAALGDDLAWRQEFCCEFVDESTSFMTHALIRSCHDERLRCTPDWNLLAKRDADIFVGVDLGRVKDVTAIWLWSRDRDMFITRGLVTLQSASFSHQESILCRILQQRGVRRMCIDATGMGLHLAERLVEQFGEHRVEKVIFTSAMKSELAGALRMHAERGQLRIPVDETITHDWHALSRLVTTSGAVRFDADRSSGNHADRFWAAALGLHAAAGDPGGTAGLVTSGRLTFARQGVW